MIINNKYTIPYKVATGAIDGYCRVTPLAFALLAQDLAAEHYGTAGLSIPHLQKMGLTWILSKQHFEIIDYPMWLDKLIVQTWAEPPKGIFCFRDFACYYAQNGKNASLDEAFKKNLHTGIQFNTPEQVESALTQEALCARGCSCWIILDAQTGTPVKPNEKTLGSLAFNTDCMEGKVFAKITVPAAWDTEEHFHPTLLDIDMNNHVNNIQYIRWILSCMNSSFCSGKLVTTLDTHFISSARYGENLVCRCARIDESVCIHAIVRADDNSEVLRARTEWTDEQKLARSFR